MLLEPDDTKGSTSILPDKSDGREGNCGRGCRFARSGDTGKRGVPGEVGIRNPVSMVEEKMGQRRAGL